MHDDKQASVEPLRARCAPQAVNTDLDPATPACLSPATEELINAASVSTARRGTSSSLGAAFNVLCAVIGTGLLQLPSGVAQSGWIGLPILILMCVMAAYTSSLIVRCLTIIRSHAPQALLGRTTQCAAAETYGDIGEAAYGRAGRWFVTFQLHLTLVMVGTIFHFLSSFMLYALLAGSPPSPPPEPASGAPAPPSSPAAAPLLPDLSYEAVVLILSAVLWAHVFLKTLTEVAFVSAINLAINVATLAAVLTETLRRPLDGPAHTQLFATDPLAFGYAFASFGFAYGVHPVLPSIYASMRKPEQFSPMIGGSFVVVLLFYVPMVIVGYGTYGDTVQTPIFNTPALSASPLITAIKAALVVNLLTTYPLVLNPPEVALEGTVRGWLRKSSSPAARAALGAPTATRIVLRTGFIGLTALISLTLRSPERFGYFLNLVSAGTTTFTSFILPTLFYIKLRGAHEMRCAELLFCLLILVVAVYGAVFGGIEAVKDLVATF